MLGGRSQKKYLVGSCSSSGHSTSSQTSLCGGSPWTNPWEGCTRMAKKRDSSQPFDPARQRTFFQPLAFSAKSFTALGRCSPYSHFFGGAPRPLYSGTLILGALVQTPTCGAMPTADRRPRSSNPSRNSVASPYPASASTIRSGTPQPLT